MKLEWTKKLWLSDLRLRNDTHEWEYEFWVRRVEPKAEIDNQANALYLSAI